MKSAVVMEGGADVEAVAVPKVPRLTSVGIAMDEDFVSKGSKWCGVVATGAVELLPVRDGRIQCGLVE